jgi:hypothetical protein
MTGLTVIRRSLRALAVLAPAEPLQAQEAEDALGVMASMLDTWRTQKLLCYVVTYTDYPLVVGQQVYTLGPGGDFAQSRPVFVDRVSTVRRPGEKQELEQPLIVLRSALEWQAVRPKPIDSAWPTKVYIDTDFPLKHLRFWPVVQAGPLYARIYWWQSISGLADLATEYEFAPGYEEAIVYNLALRLAPEFGVDASPLVRELAAARMGDVKRTNLNADILVLDRALPGRRRFYNYLTDMFQR